MNIPTSLSIYPYKGNDPAQLRLAKKVKEKFQFSDNDDEFIANINKRIMSPEMVRETAKTYLHRKKQLPAKQAFFLNVVKLSALCKNVHNAATNSLMILGATNYSLEGAYLPGIQVSDLRLTYKILDKADLSRANLKRADLSECSLEKTIFNGANLKKVNFGHLPFLNHESRVLAAALSPNQKHLVSMVEKAIYKWNLSSLKGKKQSIPPYKYTTIGLTFPYYTPLCFLRFFAKGKFFLRGFGQGEIEIWETKRFKKIDGIVLEGITSFSFFELTKNEKRLIAVAREVKKNSSLLHEESKDRVCIWDIQTKDETPQLKLRKTKIIKGTVRETAFSNKTNLLATLIYDRSCIEFYTIPTCQKKKEWTISLTTEKMLSIRDILFYPTGNKLLTNSSDEVRAWDYKKQKPTSKRLFSEESISMPAFLSSNAFIYLKGRSTICIRNIPDNFKLVSQIGYELSVWAMGMHFFTDENRLFRFADHKIVITSLKNSTIRDQTPFGIHAVCTGFTTDEKEFLFSNGFGGIFRYNSKTGKEISKRTLSEHQLEGPDHAYYAANWIPYSGTTSETVYVCSLSLDAKYILGSQRNQRANSFALSRVKDGFTTFSLKTNFFACALSEDNSYLVSVSKRKLRVWNLASNEKLATVKTSRLFEKQIKLLLSSKIFPVALLAIEEMRESTVWEVDWGSPIQTAARKITTLFDASKLYFTSELDLFYFNYKKIYKWNIKKGKKKLFSGIMNDFNISHNGRIMAVVEEIPSPDGSLDKIKSKITVWDLQKTKKVDEKDLKSHDMYVCISPTGKYVTCWDDKNGTLYFWEVGDQLRLLWKNPQRLEVSEMQVGEDTKLDPKNALLLSQLGVNMKK